MTEENGDLPANKKKKEKERCNALMEKLSEVRTGTRNLLLSAFQRFTNGVSVIHHRCNLFPTQEEKKQQEHVARTYAFLRGQKVVCLLVCLCCIVVLFIMLYSR